MPTSLELRGLHAPAPLAWPGPTVFEWLLLALGVAVLLLVALRARRTWRRAVWRRTLEAELEQLAAVAVASPEEATRQALGLVRRMLLLHHPREEVASLTGEAWLQALDSLSASDWFTQGDGRALCVEPFARPGDASTVQLALQAAGRLVTASTQRRPDPPDA